MSRRPLFFAFLALCLGIWICSIFHVPFLFEEIYPVNHIKNFTPKEPIDACIDAIIVSDPVSQAGSYNRIKTTFTARAVGTTFTVAPNRAGASHASAIVQPVSGLINVISFDDRSSDLEYGDNVFIKGLLSRPSGLTNPGAFDYSDYLAQQGIYSSISVKKGDFISVLSKDKANRFLRKIFIFKHKLRILIKNYLPSREGSILAGILLGDRSGISAGLKDRFVKTGTVHVLVISGLNVGLIAAIFILFLKFLRLPRFFVYFLSSAFLILYAVLTGASIPVVRATVMTIAVLAGIFLGRKVDILNCLGLSGIIILLKNPSALFNAGFQLSFATVISIIIFAPKFEELLGVGNKEFWLKRYILRSIAVSLAAWLGIIPVIAYHFNIISPVCMLANIPVVFLMSLVVFSGMAFLSLGLLVPFLADIFGLATMFFANILIKAVVIFSNLPYGFFWMHKWNIFETAIFYFALGVIGLSLYNKKIRKSYSVMAVLLFLNVFIWQGNFTNPPDELNITILDVGHGDAIVIRFPGGGCALIDAGKATEDFDTGKDIITPYLLNHRVNVIDAVFITHPDDDHYGGVISVLRNFKVRNIFDNNGLNADSKNFYMYQKLIKEKNIPHISLKRSDKITGFKGAQFIVLNPPLRRFSGTGSDDNNNSLVLKLKTGKYSFLFCADIKDEAMKDLLNYSPYLRSDFIKIPHHGSAFGPVEQAFVKACLSQAAFISASPKDVSPDLIKALSFINCKVYKTYSDGAIIIHVTNEEIKIESASNNKY